MKKEIRIDELRVMMLDALALRGIGSEDADFIVDDFLDAELEGHKTHGVSKFLTLDIGLSGRESGIEIVRQTGGHAKIDGHRELGHIAARQAAALSAELAKEHGVGLVALTNVSRYARLVPYSRLIAERGCIGIVTNNGGPAHVVPFDGSAPMFGTNPLSFGFPQGEKPPLLFDFATAQGVWGELRQAIVEERSLPERTFLDAAGAFTTDPQRVQGVLPFGGARGAALCMALEILTGAFVGAKMGGEIRDEYDLGYLFCALSPEMFSSADDFIAQTSALAEAVRTSAPAAGNAQVFVPGERSAQRRSEQLARGTVELEADVYDRIRAMSLSREGGYENSRSMN